MPKKGKNLTHRPHLIKVNNNKFHYKKLINFSKNLKFVTAKNTF